jgi:cyclase
MLKKRILGVITVRQGWAVQSIGYRRYLPLGRPEILAENLDRWGVDEILIQCIDRSIHGLGPDFDVLRRIAARGVGTPLVYGGGINSDAQAAAVIAQGADRILVDASFYEQPTIIRHIASKLGAQAVIASVPISAKLEGPVLWDYRRHQNISWPVECSHLLADGVVSEVLVIDKDHEGIPASFDASLLSAPFLSGCSLIPFGGISEAEQIQTLLSQPSVSAVAIGNFLSYREHAVQSLKKAAKVLPTRPPYYVSENVTGNLSYE